MAIGRTGPGVARVIEGRKSGFLLGALVLAHLVVISRQVEGEGGVSLMQRAIWSVLLPPQRVVASTIHGVKGVWQGYVGLRGTRDENRRLQEQVRSLESRLEASQEQIGEAARLREILELRPILPFPTLTAQVIAREGVPWFRNITIDKGLSDGVTLNAPVLGVGGVMGRVVEVGPRAAKVQLLLDRDSGMGVRIERTRTTGVVAGQVAFSDSGTSELLMKYVPVLADVAVGDVVVTSGLDQMYPKGLVVGRVRSVGKGSGLFKEVAVQPSANFEKIEEVMVAAATPPTPQLTESVR
jgi:rod shape-determining protein MreC